MTHSSTPEFCVYLLTNTVNGKRYVGISSDGAEARWRQHNYDAKNRPVTALHHAIRKYAPESFTVEVLERCLNFDMLKIREIHWIARLKTKAPRGYNLTDGGDGVFGYKPTPETIRRISLAHLGKKKSPEMRAKMREIALNRSPEHLAKIAAAVTGKRHTPEAIEKVRQARARQVFSPESIEKRTQKLRGRRHTDQARANMAAAQRGKSKPQSQRDNIRDSLRILTVQQAAIIRFNAFGLRQKDYAILFGVSPQLVNGIVKGRDYTEVTVDDLPGGIDCHPVGWA